MQDLGAEEFNPEIVYHGDQRAFRMFFCEIFTERERKLSTIDERHLSLDPGDLMKLETLEEACSKSKDHRVGKYEKKKLHEKHER